MTIGSAAFLPGPAPAAPLPAFGSFQPGSFRPASFQPPASFEPKVLPGTASPRRSPPALAADDWPCGRLLVVEPQAIVAFDLQRILREAGYRVVGPAGTAAEARRLVDRMEIDGAIVDLDLEPSAARAITDLLDDAGIPIVFLAGAALEDLPERHRDRPLVHKPYTGAGLLTAVRQALEQAGGDGEGDESDILYPLSPPSITWPRVFPQL